MPDGTNLKIFKEGIKPMWEDDANYNGGKWVFLSSNQLKKKVVSTTKQQTHQIMQNLVLAVIGEQFEYSDGIVSFFIHPIIDWIVRNYIKCSESRRYN